MANTEIRTQFPALEERKSYLEHAAYTATLQANDAISAGKADVGSQLWYSSVQREMSEINYILHYFELLQFRKEHEWHNWQTAVVALFALISLILSMLIIGWTIR